MHFGAIALGGVWPLGSLGMFVSEKKGISSSHENKPWFTNFHITSLILFFEGFFQYGDISRKLRHRIPTNISGYLMVIICFFNMFTPEL
jgi:hypothetical protein